MTITKHCLLAFAGLLFFMACDSSKKDFDVLVFSATEGFRHESITAGKKALLQLANEKGFNIDTTEDASFFKEKNLR